MELGDDLERELVFWEGVEFCDRVRPSSSPVLGLSSTTCSPPSRRGTRRGRTSSSSLR